MIKKMLSISIVCVISAFSAQGTIPDFLIIGVTKCGSTSLYDYITQHPKIAPAIKKEVHFFDKFFGRGISWYESQFPQKKNGVITGEATPNYFWKTGCLEKIARHYPTTKFILILRDPVKRTISNYFFRKNHHHELRSFEKAVFGKHVNGCYIKAGHYSEDLARWLSIFPRKQFHILFLEELSKNPEAEVNKVFKFLGLSPHKLPTYSISNKSYYDPTSISKESIAQLKKYYKPYNEQLALMLNRPLPWNL